MYLLIYHGIYSAISLQHTDILWHLQFRDAPNIAWTSCIRVPPVCSIQLHELRCWKVINHNQTPGYLNHKYHWPLWEYLNEWIHVETLFVSQIVIWWAGLMRGAVSIALAFKQVFLVWLFSQKWRLSLSHSTFCSVLQFTSSGVAWNPVNATMITSIVVVVLFSTLVLFHNSLHLFYRCNRFHKNID